MALARPAINLYDTLATTITELGRRWEPHSGQTSIINPLILGQKRFIFLNWGRQSGKTELVSFLAWAWGRLHPGSQSHYFAPMRKQAKEILWSSNRIQGFGPKSWVKDVSETELRIRWANHNEGLFQLHGADDENAVRGIFVKAGLLILDEFRDFSEDFWPVAEPLTIAWKCPVIIISTPPHRFTDPVNPEHPNCYVKLANRAKTRADGLFSHMPSSGNPHLDPSYLEDIQKELYDSGQGHLWEREYEAKWVTGGATALFPMLSKPIHVRSNEWIRQEMAFQDCQYIAVFDPGSTAAFAVLLMVLTSKGELFCVDEIYEREQGQNSAHQVFDEALEKMRLWNPDLTEWRMIFDSAASWFKIELQPKLNRLGLSLHPTQKHLYKKEIGEPRPGVSKIKKGLLEELVIMGPNCRYLYWEMESFGLDSQGKLSKHLHDHLIDCLIYGVNESSYVPGEKRGIFRVASESRREIDAINRRVSQAIEADYV